MRWGHECGKEGEGANREGTKVKKREGRMTWSDAEREKRQGTGRNVERDGGRKCANWRGEVSRMVLGGDRWRQVLTMQPDVPAAAISTSVRVRAFPRGEARTATSETLVPVPASGTISAVSNASAQVPVHYSVTDL